MIVRTILDAERAKLRASRGVADRDAIRDAVCDALRDFTRPKLGRIINGTGVILHTNLGRAPVSAAAAEAMREAAESYVALEMDMTTGQRGGRMDEMTRLFQQLTGCEAALVVNNNAAATMLVLAAVLAPGKTEVVLSRAEAVEIGGSFRIPDILRQSGATLVDVGTTNRTYRHDYEQAITDQTAALLKVHTSNFRLTGFVHQTPAAELVGLAEAHSIPVIDDLGSGALVDTTAFGLAPEPTLRGSITGGSHLVCASGDKLLGGPQAGIILGRRAWVAKCAAHPLARAFRADKTTLAGLAATLRHYLRDEHLRMIPVWRMISASQRTLEDRCLRWRGALIGAGLPVEVMPSLATVGGGSLPGESLPSFALTLTDQSVRAVGGTLDQYAGVLRRGAPPLIAHVDHDRLWVDARAILPEDDSLVPACLLAAWNALVATHAGTVNPGTRYSVADSV